jgi:hypothetical protein
MELFKELICFLRIMLESEDTAHNDIALGALHKIFYISYSVSPLLVSPSHLAYDLGPYGSCQHPPKGMEAREIFKTAFGSAAGACSRDHEGSQQVYPLTLSLSHSCPPALGYRGLLLQERVI